VEHEDDALLVGEAREQSLECAHALAALDVTVKRDVRRFLADRLRAWRLPTVVITHDRDDAAALDGDVLVMERGRVIQRGRLAELERRPETDFVRQFTAGRGTPPPPAP